MADTKSTDTPTETGCEAIELTEKVAEANDNAVAAKVTGALLQDPNILAAFEQQLSSMVGQRSGYIESLPKSVQRRIKALKRLQLEIFNVEADFYRELHDLDAKYHKLYQPLYDKRQNIINAVTEPTDSECECDWETDEEEEPEKAKIEEIDETKKDESKEEKKDSAKSQFDENTKGVPDFWLTIFKNVDILDSLVEESDEPVLRCLKDVKATLHAGGEMGFTLEFIFGPNDYFTNEVLTKEYKMDSKPNPKHPLAYEGPYIVKSTGCTIDWKSGKNVTVKMVKQKQKGKGGAKKMVSKQVKCDSFFNFFSPPQVKEGEEDEDEEVSMALLNDYEIGHLLQDAIIPKAVLYFTGEALDHDDEYEYGDEGEDEEGDDEDDPDYKPAEGKEAAPECKQQ